MTDTETTTTDATASEEQLPIRGGVHPEPPPAPPAQYIDVSDVTRNHYMRRLYRTDERVFVLLYERGDLYTDRDADLSSFLEELAWITDPAREPEDVLDGVFGEWMISNRTPPRAVLALPCGDFPSFEIRRLAALARTLPRLEPCDLDDRGIPVSRETTS